jgi:O-antigen ligase
MRRWLLLVFLATIAIDWPQLPFGARATDVAFVAAALAILTQARPFRPSLTALDLAVAAYLAGSVVSVIFSPAPRASAIDLVRQLYVVAIYVVIVLATRQGLAATVATGLALSGALLAALGLAAVLLYYLTGATITAISPVMSLPYLGDTLRLRAFTASEAMFACVLAVAVPFLLLHPSIAASRTRSWVAGISTACAAAMTFSHSISGIAVASVTALWDRLRTPPARAAAVSIAVLVVLAFNFAATLSIRSIGNASLRDTTVYHYAVDAGRAQIAGLDVEYQTMSYWRLKQVAWQAFTSRPLTGIGLDRFHTVTEASFQQGRLTEPYRAIDPHSTLVGRLAETGLIGGATLIILWIVIASECRRLLARRPSPAPSAVEGWIATAAVAALAGTLVNTMNADVMNFRFAWVAIGLVRGLSDQNPR